MTLNEAWSEVWKSFVLIAAGMLLLRIAGRKSISQMTVPTTVIMVSIGTVIVQPIANKSIWMALLAASVFVLLLIAVEFIQIKWDLFERFMRSQSVVVILDGQLQTQELKKMRLSVDQLEMKLRQTGITRIEDIKTATIESNGQLGYELMDEAKPVTMKQLQQLMDKYINNSSNNNNNMGTNSTESQDNLFAELRASGHAGSDHDKMLQ